MFSTKDNARLKIDEFEKRSSDTEWINIKKEDLVSGLRDRIDHPDHVNTRVVNLCGPGAFFRFLAMDHPVMYVQAVISMYETNSALIGQRVFKATVVLRNATPVSGIDPVDWIALTSLRDDENLVRHSDASGGVFGMTLPAALENWFKQAGYTDVKNETHLVFRLNSPLNNLLGKGLENIKQADRWTLSGYRVCLLIDADVLECAKQNNSSFYPDHWVGLQDNSVNVKNDNISAKVHSWGHIMPIPEIGTMTVATFLTFYYGYIAAKPA